MWAAGLNLLWAALSTPWEQVFSSVAACTVVVWVGLVVVQLFGVAVWLQHAFGRPTLTWDQTREAYRDRRLFGKVAIPGQPLQTMRRLIHERSSHERQTWLFSVALTCVIIMSNTLTTYVIFSLIGNFTYNPLRGVGVLAKLVFFLVTLRNHGLNLNIILPSFVLAFGGMTLRTLIVLTMSAFYSSRWADRFSTIMFPSITYHRAENDDGESVYFFGVFTNNLTDPSPPTYNSSVNPFDISKLTDVFTAVFPDQDLADTHVELLTNKPFMGESSCQHRGTVVVRRDISLTNQELHDYKLQEGQNEVNYRTTFHGGDVHFQRIALRKIADGDGRSLYNFSATGIFSNADLAINGSMECDNRAGAFHVYTYKGTNYDIHSILRKISAVSHIDVSDIPTHNIFLSLGLAWFLAYLAECVEIFVAIISAYLLASGVLKMSDPSKLEHPDAKPESKTQCLSCNGPHLTFTCARKPSWWSFCAKHLNGSLLSLIAGVFCLASPRGLKAARSIYKGLQHGFEFAYDYDGSPSRVLEYDPHLPLFQGCSVPVAPRLNGLIETAMAAPESLLNRVVLNNMLVYFSNNKQTAVNEVNDIISCRYRGIGESQQERIYKRKADFLGLPLVDGMGGDADSSSYFNMPDTWSFDKSIPMGSKGLLAHFSIKVKKTSAGYDTKVGFYPVNLGKDSGVLTPPTNPEFTLFDFFENWLISFSFVSVPLAYYVYNKLKSVNVGGSACSKCGLVERDHLDGGCADYKPCQHCSSTSHRSANCAEKPADKPGLQEEGKKQQAKRICRFSSTACPTADCPNEHRDFSVVNHQSFMRAFKRGDVVVCLHHDPKSPCIQRDFPTACDLGDCSCVELSVDGKGRVTGSLSVPAADIYYTPVAVFDPILTNLNLRPVVVAEGANDATNRKYASSARAAAHREDARSHNRIGGGGGKRSVKMDKSRLHGSDTDDWYEHLVAQDKNIDDWADTFRVIAKGDKRLEQELDENFDDFVLGWRRENHEEEPGRGALQRLAFDTIKTTLDKQKRNRRFNQDLHGDVDDFVTRIFNEEAAKKELARDRPDAGASFCHDFCNGRCSKGPSCKYVHVKFADIPVEKRHCIYGDLPNACDSGPRCVFKRDAVVKATAEFSVGADSILKQPGDVQIIKRKIEPEVNPEAAVRSNPVINFPSATPIEVLFNDGTTSCSVYGWRTSQNTSRHCFLFNYHIFGDKTPQRDDVVNIGFKAPNAPSFVHIDCKLVSFMPFARAKDNDWKISFCVVEAGDQYRQSDFPGVKNLNLSVVPVTTRTSCTLYPPLGPGRASSGSVWPSSDGIYAHNLSMPAQLDGNTIQRCGRLIVTAQGVVGIHTAGNETTETNFCTPSATIVKLLSSYMYSSQPVGDVGDAHCSRFRVITDIIGQRFNPVPPEYCYGQGPLDVLGQPTGECHLIGTCKRIVNEKPDRIYDQEFFNFIKLSHSLGKHTWLVDAYIAFVKSDAAAPLAFVEWALSVSDPSAEGIYDGMSLFTHKPAVLPDEATLHSSLMKFFRRKRADAQPDDLSIALFQAAYASFFRKAADRFPYHYQTLDEAFRDVEDHGNEYKSGGSGSVKNEALRRPEVVKLLESCDEIPCTVYSVGNKKELRTIGKTMRQFMIMDPVSYIQQIRWLRWFVEILIHDSATGEFDGSFFNTFSPFGGPAELVRRFTSHGCSQFWCYDASKSECNDFTFVLKGLAGFALQLGAPVDDVCFSVECSLNPVFFDVNRGLVFVPTTRCVNFNASGAFITTILTSFFWNFIAKLNTSSVNRALCFCNAGDDGVAGGSDLTGFDVEFNKGAAVYGAKAEFEPSAHSFDSAKPGDFNFCSVTFASPSYPFITRGKKVSSLAFIKVQATHDQRMSMVDSVWLSSIFDADMRDVIECYREYLESRGLGVYHRFNMRKVFQLYDLPYDVIPAVFEAEESGLDGAEAQALTMAQSAGFLLSLMDRCSDAMACSDASQPFRSFATIRCLKLYYPDCVSYIVSVPQPMLDDCVVFFSRAANHSSYAHSDLNRLLQDMALIGVVGPVRAFFIERYRRAHQAYKRVASRRRAWARLAPPLASLDDAEAQGMFYKPQFPVVSRRSYDAFNLIGLSYHDWPRRVVEALDWPDWLFWWTMRILQYMSSLSFSPMREFYPYYVRFDREGGLVNHSPAGPVPLSPGAPFYIDMYYVCGTFQAIGMRPVEKPLDQSDAVTLDDLTRASAQGATVTAVPCYDGYDRGHLETRRHYYYPELTEFRPMRAIDSVREDGAVVRRVQSAVCLITNGYRFVFYYRSFMELGVCKLRSHVFEYFDYQPDFEPFVGYFVQCTVGGLPLSVPDAFDFRSGTTFPFQHGGPGALWADGFVAHIITPRGLNLDGQMCIPTFGDLVRGMEIYPFIFHCVDRAASIAGPDFQLRRLVRSTAGALNQRWSQILRSKHVSKLLRNGALRNYVSQNYGDFLHGVNFVGVDQFDFAEALGGTPNVWCVPELDSKYQRLGYVWHVCFKFGLSIVIHSAVSLCFGSRRGPVVVNNLLGNHGFAQVGVLRAEQALVDRYLAGVGLNDAQPQSSAILGREDRSTENSTAGREMSSTTVVVKEKTKTAKKHAKNQAKKHAKPARPQQQQRQLQQRRRKPQPKQRMAVPKPVRGRRERARGHVDKSGHDDVSRDALVVAHYVAAPDELSTVRNSELPVVPDEVGGFRTNLVVTTQESGIDLMAHNKLLIAAGQHRYAGILMDITNMPSGAKIGDIVLLEPTGGDFRFEQFADPQTGDGPFVDAPPRNVYTSAIIMSSNNEPRTPTPRRVVGATDYGSNTATTVWWAGSLGKIHKFVLSSSETTGEGEAPPKFLDCVLLGHVINGDVTPNQAYWRLFCNTTSTAAQEVFVQPIEPTTGLDVLSLATDTANTPPLLSTCDNYPYRTVCNNLRIATLISALQNSASVKAYRVPGHGANTLGAKMGVLEAKRMHDTLNYDKIFADDHLLSFCARQINVGFMRASDPDWLGINCAERMYKPATEDDYSYPDYAAAAALTRNSSVITLSESTTGLEGCSWIPGNDGGVFHNDVAYVHIDCETQTEDFRWPVLVSGVQWIEMLTSAVSGLTARPALVDPKFGSALATVACMPGMASYHSFKKFFSGMWDKIKEGGKVILDHVSGVAKTAGSTLMRDGSAILRDVSKTALTDLVMGLL